MEVDFVEHEASKTAQITETVTAPRTREGESQRRAIEDPSVEDRSVTSSDRRLVRHRW